MGTKWTWKRLQLRKELNALIVGITNHQSVVIVHTHPCWKIEFPKSSVFTTILLAQLLYQMEGLTRIKDLHHMVYILTRDMQITMQVHTQSSCTSTDLEIEEVLLAITTPHRDSSVAIVRHTQHGRSY